LLEFTALLCFQGKRRGGACQQPANTDGFTGLITVTIVTGIDTRDRLFNFF
jgi:hypothetical protein